MSDLSARFIGEPVEVVFEKPPLFSKKPPCPGAFIWRGQTFAVLSVIKEWRDFRRRGRMSSNMRPENLAKAAKRGSWGVGRYYFQIMVENGRIFELYYDRAPKGQKQREGSWHLNRELFP
ncbi:MAG: hypothetical protein KC419_17070 [Anaerolineales bacterium]|nr:hypothetical protein [Anaerolineales bacterium]MCA9930199.1 hypothetical protein [Anaerolineales bacterium]